MPTKVSVTTAKWLFLLLVWGASVVLTCVVLVPSVLSASVAVHRIEIKKLPFWIRYQTGLYLLYYSYMWFMLIVLMTVAVFMFYASATIAVKVYTFSGCLFVSECVSIKCCVPKIVNTTSQKPFNGFTWNICSWLFSLQRVTDYIWGLMSKMKDGKTDFKTWYLQNVLTHFHILFHCLQGSGGIDIDDSPSNSV